ncbi:MAG: methyltransferase domain-containing protein [Planctomycetota bacterium]
MRRPPPTLRHATGLRLLNLGCGERFLPGWVNADYFKPQQWLRGRRKPDWIVDVTAPLPAPSGTFDGVLLEHVNEHLTYSANLRLLREVARILRPGGTLRVVVPALERYLEWPEARLREPKLARFASLPEALSSLTQNHQHRSVWDTALMCETLTALGFVNVRSCAHRDSECAALAAEAESHAWESVQVEADAPG